MKIHVGLKWKVSIPVYQIWRNFFFIFYVKEENCISICEFRFDFLRSLIHSIFVLPFFWNLTGPNEYISRLVSSHISMSCNFMVFDVKIRPFSWKIQIECFTGVRKSNLKLWHWSALIYHYIKDNDFFFFESIILGMLPFK